MKLIGTQLELESTISKINNDCDAKIEHEQIKGSGLVYERAISMQLSMYKTNSLTSCTSVKLPSSNQAILGYENFDIYCVLWSILIFDFPTRTSQDGTATYKRHFLELNIEGLLFGDGLRIEDTPILQTKHRINLRKFKLKVDKDKLEHLPICISGSESNPDTPNDLKRYWNQY